MTAFQAGSGAMGDQVDTSLSTLKTIQLDSSNRLREVLVEAVLLELNDIQEEESVERVMKIMQVASQSGLYVFFSPKMLAVFTEGISTHVSLRQFILGLHARANALLLSQQYMAPLGNLIPSTADLYGQAEAMIKATWGGLYDYGEAAKDSLVGDAVRVALCPGRTDLDRLLSGNPWLITLYLVVALKAADVAFQRAASAA